METVELLRGARLLRAASLVAYFLRVRSYKRHVWGLFEVSCAPVEGGKLQISWVSRATSAWAVTVSTLTADCCL